MDMFGPLPVSARTAFPASRFMNAQSGICSVVAVKGCCAIFFIIILAFQVHEAHQSLYGESSTFTAWSIPEDKQYVKRMEAGMKYQKWLVPLGSILACCGMAAWVYVARVFVIDRNLNGLRCCWLTEGCCCMCGCLEWIGSIISFFVVSGTVYSFSDPKAICADSSNNFGYTPGAAANANTQCETWVAACKVPLTTLSIMLVIFCIIELFGVCACGFGAKTAYDTELALEDEEFGGFAGGAYY